MKPVVILTLEEAKILSELVREDYGDSLEDDDKSDLYNIVKKLEEQYDLGKGNIIKKKD